jgi:hypothetical protein
MLVVGLCGLFALEGLDIELKFPGDAGIHVKAAQSVDLTDDASRSSLGRREMTNQ